MKNILFIGLLILFCACSSGSSSNKPGNIELSIWKEIQKGHYEEAMSRFIKVSTNEKSSMDTNTIKIVEKGFSNRMKEEINQKGKIKKVKLVNEKIENNDAEVVVLLQFENGETKERTAEYTLIDNKWLRI